MDTDLEERIVEFKDRREGVEGKRSFAISKNIVKRASRKSGEQLLSATHVRTIAYILGYDDTSYSYGGDGPSGISSSVFNNKIKPLIPNEAGVNPGDLGMVVTKKRDPTLYKVPGVKTAMQELSPVSLYYTEERFKRALGAAI